MSYCFVSVRWLPCHTKMEMHCVRTKREQGINLTVAPASDWEQIALWELSNTLEMKETTGSVKLKHLVFPYMCSKFRLRTSCRILYAEIFYKNSVKLCNTFMWCVTFLAVATGAVCPPVALETGVALLCQLFQMWDQVAAGIVNLTEWQLGDEKLDTSCVESPDLVGI